jgi:hypothetical protein
MTSPYRIERDRGTKEARQQLAVLREKWPFAFPSSIKTFGHWRWASPARSPRQCAGRFPTRSACLAAGKWRRSTVRLVLAYEQRIALDGSPAETVDAEAKDLATKQLAQLAARKAAKKAAEAAAPAVVKPKHAPAPAPPTKTPEQLRDRVRVALLRRRA